MSWSRSAVGKRAKAGEHIVKACEEDQHTPQVVARAVASLAELFGEHAFVTISTNGHLDARGEGLVAIEIKTHYDYVE